MIYRGTQPAHVPRKPLTPIEREMPEPHWPAVVTCLVLLAMVMSVAWWMP